MKRLFDEFLGQALGILPGLIMSLFVFLLFWIAAKISRKIFLRLSTLAGLDDEVKKLFAKTINVTILIFGAITALGTAGVNVSALVAGLGLTGFALGFALKDALSNLLAGVLILVYRPFRPGDRIVVKGHDGVVAGIDLRYTTLKSDDKTVLIPNSSLFTNEIAIKEKGG